MPFSYKDYPNVDGSTNTFTITFDYQKESEISVTVDGVATTIASFPSSTQVQLTDTAASLAGKDIRIRRTTDLNSREVDFASGSVLTEEDLDNSNIQVFHAAQEAIDTSNDSISLDDDDKWDANSKVIKNVADPVNNNDAVNKQFISTNIPNITTVAGIAQDVTDVAGIASDVTAVADDATDIGTVATDIADVTAVATDIADVRTVATDIADVRTVADDISDVSLVADDISDVTTVATDIADVRTNAANITDIQNAEEHAQEAKDYATKTDGEVQENGANTGNYSAKAWANHGTGVTSTAGAGSSKQWAVGGSATPNATTVVDGTEYSAKGYAIGALNRGSAGAHSAKDWATYTGGTVDGTYKSARQYALDAQASVATFDDKYAGGQPSDAAADTYFASNNRSKDAGDIYYNTGNGALRVWTGSQWADAAVDTSSFSSTSFSLAMAIAL
jgi:hypothetical protein